MYLSCSSSSSWKTLTLQIHFSRTKVSGPVLRRISMEWARPSAMFSLRWGWVCQFLYFSVFRCISSIFLCISSVFLCISSVFLLHGVSQTKCNVLAQVRLSLLILCKVKFITLATVSTTKNFCCLARVCTAKKIFFSWALQELLAQLDYQRNIA